MSRYEKGTDTTTLYIHGNGLIYEKTGDSYLYHHYNNLGSTMKLTDEKGVVVTTYGYGTYGELLWGDTSLTRFLYNGRCGVSTDDNGLYYMRQRYYNAQIKRFVNQDILTGSIDNSQSLNRYSYVQGNPVSYTDPFGLSLLNSLFSGTNLIHTALALASLIPGGWGAFFSVVDAAVYALVDKDFGMAGLSILDALTFGVGRGLALGNKLSKSARGLLTTADVMAHAANFARGGSNFIETGAYMYDKYVIQGQSADSSTPIECLMLMGDLVVCGLSAKGISGSTRNLAKMMQEEGVIGKMKGALTSFANLGKKTENLTSHSAGGTGSSIGYNLQFFGGGKLAMGNTGRVDY